MSVYCDRVREFDNGMHLLYTFGSVYNCLSRFLPEIHWHVAGTFRNQQIMITATLVYFCCKITFCLFHGGSLHSLWSGRPSYITKTRWALRANHFSSKFFGTGHAINTILYHFQWPLRWAEIKGSAESKTRWRYLLSHFSTDRHVL